MSAVIPLYTCNNTKCKAKDCLTNCSVQAYIRLKEPSGKLIKVQDATFTLFQLYGVEINNNKTIDVSIHHIKIPLRHQVIKKIELVDFSKDLHKLKAITQEDAFIKKLCPTCAHLLSPYQLFSLYEDNHSIVKSALKTFFLNGVVYKGISFDEYLNIYNTYGLLDLSKMSVRDLVKLNSIKL